MQFVKKYWTTLTAFASIIMVTDSGMFWLDARYESKVTHSREICSVRNEVLVLSNGLAKIVLNAQSEDIIKELSELEPNKLLKKLTLETDLDRIQKLRVHIATIDVEELKNVC